MKKVVQFNEKHKWVGCFGFVDSEKEITRGDGLKDTMYMVGVPQPTNDDSSPIAYIRVMKNEVDIVGETNLVPKEGE